MSIFGRKEGGEGSRKVKWYHSFLPHPQEEPFGKDFEIHGGTATVDWPVISKRIMMLVCGWDEENLKKFNLKFKQFLTIDI